MPKVTKAELVSLLRQEIIQADGWGSSDLAALRERALGYYFGELPGPEPKGRSVAVSTDVADMVEAVVAQILPGFSGDNVVEFEPMSEEDIEQAQRESDIVNDVILEQNRGYVFFQEALRDALLLRNGWTECYSEQYAEVSQKSMPGQIDGDALASLIAHMEEQKGVVSVEAEFDADDQKTRFKITVSKKRLCVGSVDPTEMLFESGWSSVFLDGIRFVAKRRFPTRSDLLEAGYSRKVVDALPAGEVVEPTPGDVTARYSRPGGTVTGPAAQPSNMPAAVQPIETYTCYYRYDGDGDGVAELHRIVLAGGSSVLEDEVVEFIPFATGTPFLQPHQLNGLGLYDKLYTVQDIKTAGLRRWLNNLEAANNSRVAVDERAVNMDDAMNTRPGGIVRVKGSPAAAVLPFPIVDTGQSALALLGYADKMRSERGGASLDLQSAEAQIAGETAHGTERQYSSREQLAAMACRTLAETLVRGTYAIVHKGLRAWFDEPVSVRRRGQFVSSDPSEWSERHRINIKSGLSIGERVQKKAALEGVMAQQEKILASGLEGQLTTMEQIYHSQLDWTRAAQLDNGERYFTNPKSPGAQKAKAAADQSAAAVAQQQSELQKEIATGQKQVEAIKSAIDKYKADTEAGFKYFDAVLSAQVEALKLGKQSAELAALSAEGLEDSNEYEYANTNGAAKAGGGMDARDESARGDANGT